MIMPEQEHICQSCGMPLDSDAIRGTETDGSPNPLYCTYCYRNGAFSQPKMSFSEMKTQVKEEMEKRDIPEYVIHLALETLPHLKRWKSNGHIL